MSEATGTLRTQAARIRTDPPVHWGAMLLAFVVGLALAHVHWVGLVVGGALVGLVTTSLVRALLGGLSFGLVALTVWAGRLWMAGALSNGLAMGQITLVAVAIVILAPVLGSLTRGIL